MARMYGNSLAMKKQTRKLFSYIHNTITPWGYSQNNTDGEAVEEWALNNNRTILHSAKGKLSFLSTRWKRGYNPDLALVSPCRCPNFEKSVCDPVPKSQHRPIAVNIRPVIRALESKLIPRFNFRKSKQGKEIYKDYTQAYSLDPFAEDTIELAELLLASVANEKKERWQELITSTDMTRNSKKAWKTISKLNSDKNTQTKIAVVTPNAVAKQLLLNGKPFNKERGYLKRMKDEMKRVMQKNNEFEPFTVKEFQEAMKHLIPGKAARLDDITSEIILHIGSKTKSWVVALLNNCAKTYQIPKLWRRAKVVALLKPGKDPKIPKSYRLVSLLCTLYKLYERMIMAGISPTVEEQLTPDQADFNILALSLQYMEGGFEKSQGQCLLT
ncbi:uncharacterized protein [Macrobrachium rosenbergii]|uniref:uncharacterized protein n=1 Tax=Macrobrachium rosenbergii TaxID=79674 RepID=UPI0034D69BCC